MTTADPNATTTTTITSATTTNTTTTITTTTTDAATNTTTTTKTTVTTLPLCNCTAKNYTYTATNRRLQPRRLQPTKMPRRLQATGCNTSCAAITNIGLGSSHDCASALAANATKKCTPDTIQYPLLAQCLPSFTLKCPENNNDASREPFVHSADKPLKCKVCGAVAVGEDRDGRTGYYKTTVTFGNNLVRTGSTDVLDESKITGYAIHIVDADGKRLNLANLQAFKVTAYRSGELPDCCNANLYVGYVAGAWPANGKMFAVVPFWNDTSSNQMQFLPVATGMSAEFTDL